MVAACRILVVDDEPMIRSMISGFLQMEGYAPISAANGAQALQEAAASPPDLILLDLRMPCLSGGDVARELRARGSHVPIVVMSATEDTEQRAREVDADGYIAKPFPLADLLGTIERFCRS